MYVFFNNLNFTHRLRSVLRLAHTKLTTNLRAERGRCVKSRLVIETYATTLVHENMLSYLKLQLVYDEIHI